MIWLWLHLAHPNHPHRSPRDYPNNNGNIGLVYRIPHIRSLTFQATPLQLTPSMLDLKFGMQTSLDHRLRGTGAIFGFPSVEKPLFRHLSPKSVFLKYLSLKSEIHKSPRCPLYSGWHLKTVSYIRVLYTEAPLLG